MIFDIFFEGIINKLSNALCIYIYLKKNTFEGNNFNINNFFINYYNVYLITFADPPPPT